MLSMNCVTKSYTIVNMEFADWLINQLNVRNISQAELGRKSGLGRAAISNYVNGRIPNIPAMRKLAAALSMPEEDLLRIAGLLPPDLSDGRPYERVQIGVMLDFINENDFDAMVMGLVQARYKQKQERK